MRRFIWFASALALTLVIAACTQQSAPQEEVPIFTDADLRAAGVWSGADAAVAELEAAAFAGLTDSRATAADGRLDHIGFDARSLLGDARALSAQDVVEVDEDSSLAYIRAWHRERDTLYYIRVRYTEGFARFGFKNDYLFYAGRTEIGSVAVSADGDLLLFTANVDGDFEVFAYDRSGTTFGTPDTLLRLTDNDVDESNVSMSLDGIVHAWETVLDAGYAGFAVLDLALGTLTSYDFGVGVTEPSLSGDGGIVVFVVDASVFGIPSIFTIEVATSALARLYDGDVNAPSLSFAGDQLMFEELFGGVIYVSLINLVTSSFTDLLVGVDAGHPYLGSDARFFSYDLDGTVRAREVDTDDPAGATEQVVSDGDKFEQGHAFWAKPTFTIVYAGSTEGAPEGERPDLGEGLSDEERTVPYEVYTFRAPVTDFYEIFSAQDYDGFLALYSVRYDPERPNRALIAGNDDFGGSYSPSSDPPGRSRIIAELEGGKLYAVVTTACGDPAAGCGPDFGNYANVITRGAKPPLPPTVLPDPDPTGFNITVRFWNDSFTDDQKAVFQQAADRWAEVIVDDVTDIPGFELTEDQTTGGAPGIIGVLDDVVIDAAAVPIDGPGGVLARAGARFVRGDPSDPDFFITTYGLMEFDTAEFEPGGFYSDIDAFAAVILHEMAHVLGFSRVFFDDNPRGDFLVGNRPASEGCSNVALGDDPRYVGPNGVTEWNSYGGADDVPIANTNGCGTADSHWREIFLDDEIMTGFAEGGGEPISRVTIGAFDDIGYGVDYAAQDAWTLPELPRLEQTAPTPTVYAVEQDFGVSFTGASLGTVTAPVTAVDVKIDTTADPDDPTSDHPANSTSGCEASDFDGFPAGNIALVQRGACSFAQKANNALAAGAPAILIFNQGNGPDRVAIYSGTFGGPIAIIGVPLTFTLGAELSGIAGLEMLVDTDTSSAARITTAAAGPVIDWSVAEELLEPIGFTGADGKVVLFEDLP